jgi:hypothetical protein
MVSQKTAIGFLAVGLVGFFVKLIFIPINQASAFILNLSYSFVAMYVYQTLIAAITSLHASSLADHSQHASH